MSLLSHLIEETRTPTATPATPATVATKPALITDNAETVASVATVAGAPAPADNTDIDLSDALATATAGVSVTADELRAGLADNDLDAWQSGDIGRKHLRTLAQAMQDGRDREAGRIPAGYEEIANCSRCGPVWLFADGEVQSCPWCINHMAGLPIPRPELVACIDCRHFERGAHPHLGRCGVDVPSGNPTRQWWDTDRHGCGRWLPDHE